MIIASDHDPRERKNADSVVGKIPTKAKRPGPGGSGKKIRRREDLADIEVAGRGECGEIDITMGSPSFTRD